MLSHKNPTHPKAVSPEKVYSIKGHHASQRSATTPRISLAKITDLIWVLLIFSFVHEGVKAKTHADLLPAFIYGSLSLSIFVLVLLIGIFIYWAYRRTCLRIISITLGEFSWSLRREPPLAAHLLQSHEFLFWCALKGIFLTLVPCFLLSRILLGSFDHQPVWMTAKNTILQRWEPGTFPGPWSYLPFYYSAGQWPRSFKNQPIIYTFPYEVGPPKQFVGHIMAHWKMPHILVTFEGPKTPHPKISRESIKNCFLTASKFEKLTCSLIKQQVLIRHITEISRALSHSHLQLSATSSPLPLMIQWNLQWISSDQLEGIFLQAHTSLSLEDRLVLITPQGQHQLIALRAPHDTEGSEAQELFFQSIQTLSLSDDLGLGRATVESTLQRVKLQENFKNLDYPDLLEYLSMVQSLLLSRISVDPKSFDSYFHLGGTAFLLYTETKKLIQSSPRMDDGVSALIKILLKSSFYYARDINPNDPKIDQLENFYLESKKP